MQKIRGDIDTLREYVETVLHALRPRSVSVVASSVGGCGVSPPPIYYCTYKLWAVRVVRCEDDDHGYERRCHDDADGTVYILRSTYMGMGPHTREVRRIYVCMDFVCLSLSVKFIVFLTIVFLVK